MTPLPGQSVIPIYIASHKTFEVCEPVIVKSIEQNTESETRIQIIRPDTLGVAESGCTGFTNLRFVVPELLRRDGYDFGIYLDVDMLVLGDIANLFSYRRPGRFVCLQDMSTEVAVVSADVRLPGMESLVCINKSVVISMLGDAGCLSAKIPLSWNVEDRYVPGANLIHFTDLRCQPWFYKNHPDVDAVRLWEHYAEIAKSL